MAGRSGFTQVGRRQSWGTLLVRLVVACLQDLMHPLAADGDALRYPLKSPAFLSEPGNAFMLSSINLVVRMGMFEQELIPSSARSVA